MHTYARPFVTFRPLPKCSERWATKELWQCCTLQRQFKDCFVLPNVVTYSATISACSRGSQWQRALAVLSSIEMGKLLPDQISFNAAITACEKAGQWQFALALLERMTEMTLESDVVGWSSVVSAMENTQNWQLALVVLESMHWLSILPNTVTMNAAISSCEKMTNMLLERSEVSFNACVLACSRARQWQMALAVFDELQESSLEVEAMTYSYILMNCEQCGLASHEVELLGSLRNKLEAARLRKDMLVHFRSFESAATCLPDKVHAADIPFFSCQDGFFYGRPGFRGSEAEAKASIFGEHEVGDLRVRFLCTKNCDATVVAVQCHKELVETETFVPYRLVPRAPCVGEIQERLKIVEAGERSLRDLREGSCCAGGVATCCCCPCNTVACFTSQEVVTEEIFFITDSMEVKERPFHKAVSRSPWRLWNWRLFGWALSYLALHMMLSPFTTASTLAGLSRWGSLAPLLLLSMITLAVWATVVTAAYACYRPSMGIKYFVAVGIIIALPFLANQFLPGSRLQCRFCFLKHQYPGQGQVRMGRMRAGRRRCLGATLLGLAVGVAWEQGFVAPKVSTNPTQRHDALLWNVAGVSSWLGIPAQAQALQPPAACPAFKTGYARRQFEGVVIYR
eukprot:symbB.v1.2.006149.t3/scaffold360.1/size220131/3